MVGVLPPLTNNLWRAQTTVRLPLRYFKEHSRNGVLESSNTPAPCQAKAKFDSHPQFQTILTLPRLTAVSPGKG
jgi:hypothetical protein